jgi:hypothetical protein
LRSQSKPVSGLGSSTRDDKRLLNWSKRGHDDYEMMPSEVSIARDAHNRDSTAKTPGIRVTNEVNITRMEGDRSPSQASTRASASSERAR